MRNFIYKYECGTSGQIINLSEPPYTLGDNDLFNYSFSFSEISKMTGRGSNIRNLRMQNKAVNLNVGVFQYGKPNMSQELNALTEVFNNDIENQKPGKLYVNDHYLQGYFYSLNQDNRLGKAFVNRKYSFIPIYPKWIKERAYTFYSSDFEEIGTSGGKGLVLPTDLPFGLTEAIGSGTIENNSLTDAYALITFYGRAENPSFTIGDKTYGIIGNLDTWDKVVINQAEKTIERITITGSIDNFFNNRMKNLGNSVFDPIPPGTSTITYSGEFSFSIVIFEERSEPLWI